MNTKNRCFLALVAASLAGILPAMAQDAASGAKPIVATVPAISPRAVPATGGASPHETISAHIGGRNGPMVTITYGRPYSTKPKTTAARVVWGTLVPWEKVWRLGADEATTLITQKDLLIGETAIPAGAYTLWMLPSEKGTSKLIINKQIGQWGLDPSEPSNVYDQKMDLARVDLKKDTIDKSVDQLTLAVVNDAASGGGVIKIQWETTQYSLAFKVKP